MYIKSKNKDIVVKFIPTFIALSAIMFFIGCKSTEEKIAEKMIACNDDACTETMKEFVLLPIEKQLAVKQLMMLDTNYQKKVAKKEAMEKVEIVSLEAKTYMMLQSAVFELSSKTGTFKWIGFSANSDNGFFIIEGEDNSFEAVSYIELLKCPSGSTWTVKPIIIGKELSYSCNIISENEQACKEISEKFLSLCR